MISVIICTYNRCEYIYTTLAKVASNNYAAEKYEIILVNNNSTDNTASECERFANDFPNAPYHYFVETNQGLSYARNRGIQEAKGDMLVFLDDDAFVGDNYLETLDKYITSIPDMAAFGGRIEPLFENGETPCWLGKWSYSWVSAIDMGENVRLFEGNALQISISNGWQRA